MLQKIKLTRWFVYEWGKPPRQKTSPGDFKVTTSKNLLLSQQAATSKGIPIPYTNLQLNPYPNTQLDLFCSDNLSFQCTTPSTWQTNRCMDPSTWLTTNLRRMLAVKFFSSSTRWRSWSSLVTKPYDVQIQQLLEEKDELGQIVSSHNMLVKNLCMKLHSLASAVTTHKIILIYV